MWLIEGLPVGIKKESEAGLKKALVQLLELKGWLVLRFNSGAHVVPATLTVARKFIRYGPKGMSDLLALKAGRPALFIEVKAKRGRLEESQKDFGRNVLAAGHCYLIVRSVDDLLAALESS